jgi:hypothetical protein
MALIRSDATVELCTRGVRRFGVGGRCSDCEERDQ